MAVWFEVWVCRCWVAGIAGSNPGDPGCSSVVSLSSFRQWPLRKADNFGKESHQACLSNCV